MSLCQVSQYRCQGVVFECNKLYSVYHDTSLWLLQNACVKWEMWMRYRATSSVRILSKTWILRKPSSIGRSQCPPIPWTWSTGRSEAGPCDGRRHRHRPVMLWVSSTIWKDGYVRTCSMIKFIKISLAQQDTYINLVEEEFVGIVLGSEDVCE